MRKLEIMWVEATDLEPEDPLRRSSMRLEKKVSTADGILIPGGFGTRVPRV